MFDSAAGFAMTGLDPERYVGLIPSVFSFHATKSFAIGERGGIACTNPELMRSILYRN